MRVVLEPYEAGQKLLIRGAEFSSRKSVEDFIKHVRNEMNTLWPKAKVPWDKPKDKK